MAFRYTNPGYVALLKSDSGAVQASNSEYSKTGVGFYHTSTSSGRSYISVISKTLTTDLYCRFDLYYQRSGVSLYCISSYSSSSSYSHGIYCSSNSMRLCHRGTSLGDALPLNKNSINRIWLHLHFSGRADTSYGELKVNDATSYVSFADRTYYGFSTSPTPIRLYSDIDQNYFSNLIISDEYISSKEQVIILPTLATETNMTAGESGLYIANAANQTLLQSVDVAELIKNYGASSVITGIELVGNPAYKIGAGSAALIDILKSGASIVERGTFELSSEANATIFDCWPVENLPIAGLSSMLFGWKVGT